MVIKVIRFLIFSLSNEVLISLTWSIITATITNSEFCYHCHNCATHCHHHHCKHQHRCAGDPDVSHIGTTLVSRVPQVQNPDRWNRRAVHRQGGWWHLRCHRDVPGWPTTQWRGIDDDDDIDIGNICKVMIVMAIQRCYILSKAPRKRWGAKASQGSCEAGCEPHLVIHWRWKDVS